MAVGTADYTMKNLNEKTNEELGISQAPEATETKAEEK